MNDCHVAKFIVWEFSDICDNSDPKEWYQQYHDSWGSTKLYTSNLMDQLKKNHLTENEVAIKKQKPEIVV